MWGPLITCVKSPIYDVLNAMSAAAACGAPLQMKNCERSLKTVGVRRSVRRAPPMNAIEETVFLRRSRIKEATAVILRNPFALREGAIVTVNDLSKEERGLRCNCVCPNCKAPFEARLGDVRVHHFAHSGIGCSEETAYIHGLFLLVKEYVEAGNPICLPELRIFFHRDRDLTFTKENFFDHISFELLNPKDAWVFCMPKTRIVFDRAEIVFSGERPSVLILTKKDAKLAVVVKPPATVCKETIPKRYKDLATVVMDLLDYGETFSECKKEEIFELLKTDRIFYWLFSPKALNAIPKANAKNDEYKEYCRKRDETLRQEEERRIQEEAARLQRQREERERAEKQRQERLRIKNEREKQLRQEQQEQQRAERERAQAARRLEPASGSPQRYRESVSGYEVIKIKGMDFNQKDVIRDSLGNRWVKCRKCGRVFREDKIDGLEADSNFIVCRDCKGQSDRFA